MRSQLFFWSILLLPCAAAVGCGVTINPDFSLVAGPSTISVVPGGAAQTLSVTATALNGFSGTVTVSIGSLPAGVTATPTSLTLTPGTLGEFSISASPTAAPGTVSISITGTSGALTQMAASSLTVGIPMTTATLSATAFDFGDNLVNNTLTNTVVTVTNTGLAALTLSPALSGDTSYSIAGGTTCGLQLAAGANCAMVLNYTPTTASAPASQNATLNLGLGNVTAGTPQTVAITGISAHSGRRDGHGHQQSPGGAIFHYVALPRECDHQLWHNHQLWIDHMVAVNCVRGRPGKHLRSRYARLHRVSHAGRRNVYKRHRCK